MANVTEYLAPIKLVYTTDYSDTVINSVDEFIEITPVVFDGTPQPADFSVLHDECRVEIPTTGAFFLCISSDYFGVSAAKVGVAVNPCYRASYGLLAFAGNTEGGDRGSVSRGGATVPYVYAYKLTDGKGLRLAMAGGNAALHPDKNMLSDDWNTAERLSPGNYVAFEGADEPTKPPITDLTGTKWLFGNALKSDYTIAFSYSVFYDVVAEYDDRFVGSNRNITNSGVFQLTVSNGNYNFLSASGTVESTGASKVIGAIYYGYNSAPKILSTTFPGFKSLILTITDGTDVTNTTLIAWLEANATLVEEEPDTSKTTITYNGNEIASLEAGQTATIKTAETEVEHDIVITPVFPINIAYGDIIATANEGQTATIKCANTEMEHDIVVSAKAEEDDSIVGTWAVNDTISAPNFSEDQVLVYSTKRLTSACGMIIHSSESTQEFTFQTSSANGYKGLWYDNGSICWKPYGVSGNNGVKPEYLISFTFYESLEEDNIVIDPAFLAWRTANATKVSEVSDGYALYNDIRLPKIPKNTLSTHPYCWIKDDTVNARYLLICATSPWYFSSQMKHNSKSCLIYSIPFENVNEATKWKIIIVRGGGVSVSADSPVIWSNHDIPNGSATATDIYFEGAEPIPTN